MEEKLPRASPTPEDELRRQAPESYIEVDTDAELELCHFKAMLVLSGMRGMALTIPENAIAAERALDRAVELLSLTIKSWHWLDRRGKPYEMEPMDNPSAFERLTMSEINWMIGTVSELLNEEATPEGT